MGKYKKKITQKKEKKKRKTITRLKNYFYMLIRNRQQLSFGQKISQKRKYIYFSFSHDNLVFLFNNAPKNFFSMLLESFSFIFLLRGPIDIYFLCLMCFHLFILRSDFNDKNCMLTIVFIILEDDNDDNRTTKVLHHAQSFEITTV